MERGPSVSDADACRAVGWLKGCCCCCCRCCRCCCCCCCVQSCEAGEGQILRIVGVKARQSSAFVGKSQAARAAGRSGALGFKRGLQMLCTSGPRVDLCRAVRLNRTIIHVRGVVRVHARRDIYVRLRRETTGVFYMCAGPDVTVEQCVNAVRVAIACTV